MKVTVNPATEATGFGYAEAGPYRLRVVGATVTEGKNFPYVKWELEFADPNTKSTDGKMPGHVFENTTLKPEGNAQFRLRQILEGLGLEWTDFDTEDAKGLELDVILGVKEYQGTFSNEVKKVVGVKK